MTDTKRKGNLTELMCIAAINELGYDVSIPYGDAARYDFIADIDGILIKVQSKTSSVVKNNSTSIKFSCRSTNNTRYTKDQVDYFCTFFNGICYLIPIEECSVEKTLHFGTPKNKQQIGISYASDYELSVQIAKIKGVTK